MSTHPEERRIAGLLRELTVQSGTRLETLEQRLGWEPGRLRSLLEGGQRLTFEDVLEVLPLLSTTPSDFFAWLYGFDAREQPPHNGAGDAGGAEASAESFPARPVMDRRFEASLQVVRSSLSRRRAWKEEQRRT
jgi:hypothetical protein